MDKRKMLLTCVACLGIAGTSVLILGGQRVTAGPQEVEEARNATTFERGDMKAKEMWKQIGRLHTQIVAIELKDATSRASDTDRSPTANERDGQSGLRQHAGLTTFSGSDAATEQLWMQLAQLHKQIVASEANGGEARPDSFSERTDRVRFSTERNQQFDREPSGVTPQRDSSLDPIWQRYVRLQQQIVAADVKQSHDSTTTPKPEKVGRR